MMAELGPLFGIDVKYTGQSNPFLPLKVKTTINKTFQDEIEELLDIHKVQKGRVIRSILKLMKLWPLLRVPD